MDVVSGSIRRRSRNPWVGLMKVMHFAFDRIERSHEDIMMSLRGADLVIISASGAAGKNKAELLGIPYSSVNLMPWGIPYTEPGRLLTKMKITSWPGSGRRSPATGFWSSYK